MAALDDELGLPPYEEGGTITGAAPASVSALGGDDETGQDYGGPGAAAEPEYTGPTTSALLADPRVQARINSPRVPEVVRQRLAELLKQRQEAPPDYQAMMNDPAAMQRELSGTRLEYPSEPKPPPKEEEAGWLDILGRGLLRATEAGKQGKDVVEGKKPRESKTPQAEYEKPLELADFLNPTLLAEKTVFGLAQSSPAIALSVAGGFAGGAAGSAIPVVGTTIGGIAGSAAGMGLGSAIMEIGPAYYAELQQTPDDTDGAWDRAMVTVGKSGLVGAASMAMFGAGKPLSNLVKSMWTGAAKSAAAPAAGAAAAPVVAGIPTRAAVQAVGQTGISVGGEVAANAIEGKPLGTNLDPAAAGAVSNIAQDVAGQFLGRGARALGRRVLPAKPGVDTDQAAALGAEQGTLPLEGGAGERPPPVGPTGQGELPLTGGAGERPPVQGEQLRLPDILGPGRQPLGDIVPPARGVEPTQGELPFGQEELPGVGRPPPEAGPPPGAPPPPSPNGGGGGQGELPLGPPPRGVGPTEQLAMAEPPTQLPLPLGTPEAPVARPDQVQPELPGIGRPEGRPGEQPGLPGIEAAPAAEQPAEVPPSTRGPMGPKPDVSAEGWTTERDHTGPGWVVKNKDGNVISVGDTEIQAVDFARARAPEQVAATTGVDAGTDVTKRGGVTEEVRAEEAKPAETGTSQQPVSVGDEVQWTSLGQDMFKTPQKVTKIFEGGTHVLVEGSNTGIPISDLTVMRRAGEAEAAPKTKGEQVKEAAAAKRAEKATAAKEKVAAVKAKAAEKLQTETRPTETEGVTKPAEASTEKAPAREPVTKAAEGTEKTAPEVGTRTKTGAFTMGEGEEMPAQRAQPTTSTSTPMSREAGRRLRNELEEQRGKQMPTPREFALPAGEDKKRSAWRLVTGLVKGDVDLARAMELYGEKLPGTRGRPRAFANLTTVVREALKHAEDPSIEVGLRAKMAAMKNADTKIYKDLDARVDLLEAARLNKEKLGSLLTDLEAIDRGTPTGEVVKSIKGRFEQMLATATRRTIAKASHDREVNAPIERLLEGQPTGLHSYLDAIINNPRAQEMTPQFVVLAKTLRRLLPDINVRHVPGGDIDEVGGYRRANDTIELNLEGLKKHSVGVETVLHEALHAATHKYVSHLFSAAPDTTLSPRSLAHKHALIAIRDELGRVLGEGYPSRLESERLAYALKEYGGTPHEIITELMSDPHVQSLLADTPASPQFRAALDSVGMGLSRTASIWDGFKRILRHIFGLGEKQDSVLDMILRPATEITEAGARFREGVDVRKTVKHNADVIDSAPDARTDLSLKRIRDAFTNTTEPGWRLALKGGMQGGTLNAIHDAIKPYIPSVSAHRTALEAVGRATYDERVRPVTTYAANGSAIVEPHIDKTMRLADEMKKGGQASKDMQALATDAQYAEASMLDPAANAHVGPNVLRDLQDRWNNLPASIRQTYKESVETYNDRERVQREGRIRQFTEGAFPGFTRAQHDDVVSHMSTRAGIEDILTNADRSALAQRMGPRWANSKELLSLLADSERGGFVRGDFFPLARTGEYVVSAGVPTDKPNYIVRMFETPAQARDFREAMARHRNDVSQVFVKTDQHFVKNMGLEQALGTLDAAMTRAGMSDASKAALRDNFAGNLIQQGTRTSTHTMRRERILGASEDQARNMINDYLSHTTRVGHLQHQGEVVRTQFQMEKEAADFRRSPNANVGTAALTQDGVNELRRRMTPVDGDNSADGLGRGTRGLTTLTVLDTLIRPMHLVFTIAGNHIAGTSMIGGKHGVVQAHLAVNKAIAQLTGTALGIAKSGAMAAYRRELKAAHWDVSQLYRQRLKDAGYDHGHVDAFMDSMNRSNLVDQTKIREMQRMAGPRGWGDIPLVGRALDVFSAGEHAIDSSMRVANGWAGFLLELKKNPGDVGAAIEYGKQIARDAMPDWNFYNKSRVATKQGVFRGLAPLVTQYKQFGLHMYGVQGNLILNSVRDPASRKEALRSIALLQGQHALLYGGIGASVFGSLPVMAGMGLYDMLTGSDRPHSASEAQTRSRNWVYDMTKSKTMADMFDRGVPMSFGQDVHRSLQFVNLLNVPEWKSYDKEGVVNLMVQALTGASGDTAAGLTDSALKILRGDWRKENMIKLAPRAIEDPLTAAFMWRTEGLKTATGDKTILRPQDFSTKDLILKGIGGIPAVVADAREARAVMDLRQKVVQDAQDHILERLVRAKEGTEREKVVAEIYRFNKSMPLNDNITGLQIQRRLRDQAMANAQPALYGMRVPKADTAAAQAMTRSMRP